MASVMDQIEEFNCIFTNLRFLDVMHHDVTIDRVLKKFEYIIMYIYIYIYMVKKL